MVITTKPKISKGAIFNEHYNIRSTLSSTGIEVFLKIWGNSSKYAFQEKPPGDLWMESKAGWKELSQLDRKEPRPHHRPAELTAEEKEMILRRYPRYKDDMLLLWDFLRKSGYTRSYTSPVRVVRKWVQPEIQKQAIHKNKSYARAEYPGQKVQADVKFVPSIALQTVRNTTKYTAAEECTRLDIQRNV